MDDRAFRRLLDFYHLSWEGYRRVRKGVKKRISRHIRQLGFRGFDEYLLALKENPQLENAAARLLTVSISRFFRDRGLWQAVEEHLLPDILERKKGELSVWSAGCACGEEVYSFKIVWETLRGRWNALPRLALRATDMNPQYLEKARRGVYRASSLKEVPAARKALFFKRISERMYSVSEELQKAILWKVHNLVSDEPPPEIFDIILLRNNLLTYYEDDLRIPAFRKILDRLARRGFLVIGSHENVPPDAPLTPSPHHPKILGKMEEREDGYGPAHAAPST